jgi:viologen exporter family transport system permease protein
MSVRRALRAYPTLLRIGLAEAVAYRAEFLVWMLSMTMPLVMLALMKTMADEAPIGRFTAQAFTGYYLATLIVRQMTGSWVVWELVREIREGSLALRLLRPIHPLLSFSAESLAALPMRGLVSLPLAAVLLWATGGEHVTRDPVVLGCFVLSLAGAWALNFAVSAMIGTLGLYLESSISIWELWLGCFMLFSGYLLPLELFPPWLEHVARALPFAYLQAVPVEMLTGLHSRASALRALGWQWTYAAGAVTAMLLLWRRAVERFAAYGG